MPDPAISSAAQKKLRKLIDLDGIGPTASRLGLSREALARAVAGLVIRAGTAALIEEKLREK